MKKISFIVAVILLISILAGCGSSNNAVEKFARNYLDKSVNLDFEGIWNMLPTQIQDYAVREGIVKNKSDAINYIREHTSLLNYITRIATSYNEERFTVELVIDSIDILPLDNDDARLLQVRLENEDINLKISSVYNAFCKYHINIGKINDSSYNNNIEDEEMELLIIKSSGKLYLISTLGKDWIFK